MKNQMSKVKIKKLDLSNNLIIANNEIINLF